MQQQNRKVLLLVDNATSHIYDPTKIPHIRVEFLDPNMTSHIQPMDAGIIRCFKAHYRKFYILHALDRDEDGENDIYHIDQLQGMKLALKAWACVSAKTVANCWKHAG